MAEGFLYLPSKDFMFKLRLLNVISLEGSFQRIFHFSIYGNGGPLLQER